MAGTHGIKPLETATTVLGLLILTAQIQGDAAVDILIGHSPEEVRVGSRVTLNCSIFIFPEHAIVRWQKYTTSGVIGITANLLEPHFKNTNYESDIEEDPDNRARVNFLLTITNAQVEDGGEYGCLLTTESEEHNAKHVLIVRDPPESIEMFIYNNSRMQPIRGGEHLEFSENATIHTKCIATGGNPQTQLHMDINNIDLESRHDISSTIDEGQLEVVNAELGQERYHYEITKEARAIPITYEYVGHHLKCIASVPGLQETIEKSFMITMDGRKPVFSCVKDFSVGDVYDRGVTLSCDVTARPLPSEMFVYWYGPNKYRTEIHAGEPEGVYHLTAEKEGHNGRNTMRMNLHFRITALQMFRTYYFVARNTLGEATTELELRLMSSSAHAQLTANLEIEPPVVYAGDNVTLTCTILVGPGTSLVNMVNWKKRITYGDTEEVTEIAVNSIVQKPIYEPTGRYTATIKTEGAVENDLSERKVILTLTITDLETTDSGLIGCELPGNDVSIDEELSVISNITEVQLTTYDIDGTEQVIHIEGQNMTFEENEQRKVYCHVSGAYPEPEVSMWSGDRDITDLFEKTSTLRADGEKGLRALTYDVSLKNDSLIVNYEYSKKQLECRAKIPDTPLPEVTKSIRVNLSGYSPKFNCGRSFPVRLHEQNFEVHCRVRADPPAIDFKVFWNPYHEANVSVGPGENNGNYRAEVQSGDDEYESVMILHVDRVFIQHFREYYFEAANTIGKSTHEIVLLNKDKIGRSSHAAAMAAPVASLVVMVMTLFVMS